MRLVLRSEKLRLSFNPFMPPFIPLFTTSCNIFLRSPPSCFLLSVVNLLCFLFEMKCQDGVSFVKVDQLTTRGFCYLCSHYLHDIVPDWYALNVKPLKIHCAFCFPRGVVGGHGGKTCFQELRQPYLYFCLWLKFFCLFLKFTV